MTKRQSQGMTFMKSHAELRVIDVPSLTYTWMPSFSIGFILSCLCEDVSNQSLLKFPSSIDSEDPWCNRRDQVC